MLTNDVKVLQGVQNQVTSGNKIEYALISYIGRVNYDYDQKYLFSASIRRDGGSRFGPANKIGYFPAFSAGWRLSEESFMQSFSALSDLKIRASYGETGNDRIGDYAFQGTINSNFFYNFAGSLQGASTITNLANVPLKWESTAMTNVGLDMGLFNDRLNLSFEWFKNQTNDMILGVPIPRSLGYDGAPVANVGTVTNQGIELALGYRKMTGDFQWSVDANFSTVNNELVSLGSGNTIFGPAFQGDAYTYTEEGQPIAYFYGWVADGLFQEGDETSQQPDAAAGDIRFRDLNDDGVIDASDRTNLGHYTPDFTYGLNLSANWNNFDMSMFIQGVQAQVLNHVFDASNPLIESVWRGWFRVIHFTNLVLENVPNANQDITEELKSRILGEAYFLRALANFELVSLWGGIPLMTQSATSPEALPRSSEEEVYQLIFSDLAEAENRLPVKSTYSGADLGRASKGAAQALAAKIHLFRANYAEAKTFLEKVISSNQYQLVPRYLDNFEEENENNAESIWEIQMTEDFGTAGGWNADGSDIAEVTFRGQEYGPNAWRNLIPNRNLVASYETAESGAAKSDPRNNYNFYRIGDRYNNGQSVLTPSDVQGDINIPSWRKYQMIYKRAQEETQSGINFRVIRYADVLLMMAEVENELSGPAAALPYLNQVRARPDVNMPLYPTPQFPVSNQQQMFEAIMHERRVEFAGEQVRNRDIRRWRRAGKLTSEPIPGYTDKNDLLPIPLQEIDNNSSLTNADQNTGY